jgi:tRNA dimethylallyltransferase
MSSVKLTYDEMFRQLEIAIHQFAKRQMTWFRGMEREVSRFIG